jgi:TetR/AcrR family transcriptional regulator, transcriptional repressor for nem operon
MRLFWTRGYEASSLEAIETSTGLSRSSLYNAFGSKRSLFGDALEAYLAFIDAQLVSPLEMGAAGLDDLRRFFGKLGMQLDGEPMVAGCLLTNSLVEFGGEDPSVIASGLGYINRARTAIRAALRRAAANGEIDGDTIDNRVEVLVGLVLSINLVARSGLGVATFNALIGGVQGEIERWRIRR